MRERGVEPGLARALIERGLVVDDGGRLRTTRRWHGAMARAAAELVVTGEERMDLRMPVAVAVLSICGDLDDDAAARFVETLADIEARALAGADDNDRDPSPPTP